MSALRRFLEYWFADGTPYWTNCKLDCGRLHRPDEDCHRVCRQQPLNDRDAMNDTVAALIAADDAAIRRDILIEARDQLRQAHREGGDSESLPPAA